MVLDPVNVSKKLKKEEKRKKKNGHWRLWFQAQVYPPARLYFQ
jgi:hypothetical protein